MLPAGFRLLSLASLFCQGLELLLPQTLFPLPSLALGFFPFTASLRLGLPATALRLFLATLFFFSLAGRLLTAPLFVRLLAGTLFGFRLSLLTGCLLLSGPLLFPFTGRFGFLALALFLAATDFLFLCFFLFEPALFFLAALFVGLALALLFLPILFRLHFRSGHRLGADQSGGNAARLRLLDR